MRRRRPARRPRLDIVHEDAHLIVINKPPGLLSVPLPSQPDADSVYQQLVEYFRSHGKRRPFVVHRIDRDTSGLVVFAKDAQSQARLKAQFEARAPLRSYLAVVYGHPHPPSGWWRDPLVWDRDALVQRAASAGHRRAVDAIAEYRTIERFRDASLIEVRLETGKRNQIRIQASLHGHPLIGERQYAGAPPPRRIDFARQALHAFRLEVRHPATHVSLAFEAPLPPDLDELLSGLRAQHPVSQH